MRIAPLGILYSKSKHLIANSEISAKITHSHPIGIDGALSMAYAISILTNLDKKDQFPLDKFCKGLIKVCSSKEMQSNFLLVFESLALNKEPIEVAKALNLSQKAHESVPFSIYAFLKFKTSFEESLYCSILNGGDQDTLGSMTASLSGAYLGKKGLPQNWLDKIENKDYIESLAKQLFKLSEIIS
jgi:poly(ADP-ribose) glycohydrolase ARH3